MVRISNQIKVMIPISRPVLRNLPTMTAEQVHVVKIAAGEVPVSLIKGIEEFNLYNKAMNKKRLNREESWQTFVTLPVSCIPEEHMDTFVELHRSLSDTLHLWS